MVLGPAALGVDISSETMQGWLLALKVIGLCSGLLELAILRWMVLEGSYMCVDEQGFLNLKNGGYWVKFNGAAYS